MREISVGVTQIFRVVDLETEPLQQFPAGSYRIEQLHDDPLTKKETWSPLAFCDNYFESHTAMHQLQDRYVMKVQARMKEINATHYRSQ